MIPRILVCLLVLSPAAAAAQEVRLDASTDSVFVGERIFATVRVDLDAGYRALFPDLGEGPLVIGDATFIRPAAPFPSSDVSVARTDSARYEVAVFGVDSARIGGIPVGIISPYGDTVLTEASSRWVGIRSVVPEDAAGIHDLAPLATFPPNLWPWILSGLALLGLTALAYYWWKRRQASGSVAPTQPSTKLDPYDEAVNRLRKLAEGEPVTSDEIRTYYIELSDTLRTYLEFTIDVPALERTSSELMAALKRLSAVAMDLLENETLEEIDHSLEISDLAKFANHRPDRSKNNEVLDLTRHAIDSIERARRQRLARAAAEAEREHA